MKGGVWPNVRLSMIALAVAGTLAGTLGPQPARAQPPADNPANPHKPPRFSGFKPPRQPRNPEHAAPEEPMRPAVPPDLDQRRRDGHMTPEERRLLRQHIEDAVRELYKR
ncbi:MULTISPECIES: hypothetical protein [Paraburkholderia]|nr:MULTISPECIES: hypothetical protein [Paraburkholderia]MCX4165207.1 hypothetical protein [Paraburkholderia megapolitana]MDN7160699.1 hypothetical protein [Paraburkholderia sp. CHISQ3]MDQ6497746.1 hypothetical protein [Paraburkholderia megapolitana]QDQ83910.1 hypothetical protein FNZ07_22480 [Paraburkholderia megapolitana]